MFKPELTLVLFSVILPGCLFQVTPSSAQQNSNKKPPVTMKAVKKLIDDIDTFTQQQANNSVNITTALKELRNGIADFQTKAIENITKLEDNVRNNLNSTKFELKTTLDNYLESLIANQTEALREELNKCKSKI